MKRIIVISLLLAAPFSILAQQNEKQVKSNKCISGNCVNGKGVMTEPDGTRYEGEFRDGKYNGKGIWTFTSGERFEGEFKDDSANGKGVITFPGGGRYEGEFKDDEYNGKGVLTFPDGKRYEGEFKDNKYNGKGIMTFPDGRRLEGEFKDNELSGKGVLTFPDGRRLEGEFKNNEFSGTVNISSPSGHRLAGEFKDGKFNGMGVFTSPDGERYEGEFKDKKYHGKGVWTNADGHRYEGEFKDGKPNGKGVWTNADGHRYEGEFKDGKLNGKGVWTNADGHRYEGEFKDGKLNGKGVLIYPDGERYEGEWIKGLIKNPLNIILLSAEKLTPDIFYAYRLDVFHYYELMEEYNSELKRELYKKTKEYEQQLAEIKIYRDEVLKNFFYVTLETQLPDYDVGKKGFIIDVSDLKLSVENYDHEETNDLRINLTSFRDIQIQDSARREIVVKSLRERGELKSGYYYIYREKEPVLLSMPPSQGLKIENNRETTTVYIMFKITGYNEKHGILFVAPARIVVGNTETGEVYYDNTFYPKK